MADETPPEEFITNRRLFELQKIAADRLETILGEDPGVINGSFEGYKTLSGTCVTLLSLSPNFDQQVELLQMFENRLNETVASLEHAQEETPPTT